MSDDLSTALFFELFEGLPRQGPGSAASTRRALAALPPLGPEARVLDVGAGTGAQTFVLASATEASIVAVDLHPPFVEALRRTATTHGLAHRVRAEVADMRALPFAAGSFECVWSEGAIYQMGFEAGLAAFRRVLVPGGFVAVTDLCWLAPEPADDVRAFFDRDSPGVGPVADRVAAIARAGYQLLDSFVLPDAAWWTDYYAPLARRLATFRARHAGETGARAEVAAALADDVAREIALRRAHPDDYGYVFFVMRAG